MPEARNRSSCQSMNGRPRTGSSDLGVLSVSGRRRVARPPASTTTCVTNAPPGTRRESARVSTEHLARELRDRELDGLVAGARHAELVRILFEPLQGIEGGAVRGARTYHVAEPENPGRDTEALDVRAGQRFAGELARAVERNRQHAEVRFATGPTGIAVDGAGRGEHQGLHAGLAHGFEHGVRGEHTLLHVE